METDPTRLPEFIGPEIIPEIFELLISKEAFPSWQTNPAATPLTEVMLNCMTILFILIVELNKAEPTIPTCN